MTSEAEVSSALPGEHNTGVVPDLEGQQQHKDISIVHDGEAATAAAAPTATAPSGTAPEAGTGGAEASDVAQPAGTSHELASPSNDGGESQGALEAEGSAEAVGGAGGGDAGHEPADLEDLLGGDAAEGGDGGMEEEYVDAEAEGGEAYGGEAGEGAYGGGAGEGAGDAPGAYGGEEMVQPGEEGAEEVTGDAMDVSDGQLEEQAGGAGHEGPAVGSSAGGAGVRGEAPEPGATAAAAAAAAALTRPRVSSAGGGGAPAAGKPLSAAAAASAAAGWPTAAQLVDVVFAGEDLCTRLRRALAGLLQGRPHPLTFAAVGLMMRKHKAVGAEWCDPANRTPAFKTFVEEAAAAVPGVFRVEQPAKEGQMLLSLNVAGLRRAALHRAAAAAFPAPPTPPAPSPSPDQPPYHPTAAEDAMAVRRAAAAALLAAESASGTLPPFAMIMPHMGSAVLKAAAAPRNRLAKARGTSFSLGAVLTGNGEKGRTYGRHTAATGHGGRSYIVIENAPNNSSVARLDYAALLQDAVSGELGNLAEVTPLPYKVPAAAAAARDSPPPAAATPANVTPAARLTPMAAAAAVAATRSPRPTAAPATVKSVLNAALPIPAGVDDERKTIALAKRALALLAMASLGCSAGQANPLPYDPPCTLRSSPCGIILGDLNLKPPKLRPILDEEPNVFRCARPSPNYLIELVSEPLLRFAVEHRQEVALSTAALLKGRTYATMRLVEPSSAPAAGPSPAPIPVPTPAPAPVAAARSAAYAAANGTAAAAGGTASTSASGAGGGGGGIWGHAAPPPSPVGQPSDYWARVEKALDERLAGGTASAFVTRVRRVVTGALLKRHAGQAGGGGRHTMSIKDLAILTKKEFPEAYHDRRPPGVFPPNLAVLAQHWPTTLQVLKPTRYPNTWLINLKINTLELAAGLTPTRPYDNEAAADAASAAAPAGPEDAAASGGDAAGWGEAPADEEELEPPPAAAAAADAAAPAAAVMPAAAVAGVLALQPVLALSAALAPTVPPDVLPDPAVHVISAPYNAVHVTALAHCLSCPQIGVAAKCVEGVPAVIALYASAADSLKPAAAANAAAAAANPAPAAASVLPAAVYVFDITAAGPANGSVLLSSLRGLLEDPSIAKVVHGCEQVVPWVEHAVGCVLSPLLDTLIVAEILRPLDLHASSAGGAEEAAAALQRAPQLWPAPSNWQAALTSKFFDYSMAVMQHATGSDSSWLVRPLTPGQLSVVVRSVQHLPELWSALTWLMPRLAQYSSLARAQQCRSMQQQQLQQQQQQQQEAQQQYEQQQL